MTITSKEINLLQLDQELGSKGLIANFSDLSKKIILPAEHSDVTESQLEKAILNHVALPKSEPTLSEKLAGVGLSVEELKAALV